MKKRWFGLIFYILFILIAVFVPAPSDMPLSGFRVIMLVIGTVIIWVTEAVPSPVGGLLFLMIAPMLGISTFDTLCSAFCNSSVIFVLASYGIAVALLNSDLVKRLLKALLKLAGKNQNRIIYAFAISTAILSSICSDIPAMLLFAGLATEFLKSIGEKPGESPYGRALMLSITYAALLGGIATPAGSAINVMALSILETNTGVTCSFLLWMIVGVPCAFFLTMAGAWLCIKIHKAPKFDESLLANIDNLIKIPEKMDRKEKIVGTMIALMLAAWISTTWITELKIATVSIIGMAILMLPGIDVLDWKEFQEGTSWSSIVFMGGIMVLASAVSSTGIATWLVEKAMVVIDFSALPAFVLFLIVAAFVGVMHIPVPAGPALMGVVVIPCIYISNAMGINPVLLTMTCAMLGSCALALPFDPVPLISYGTKYYTIKDMAKAGIPLYFVWIVVIAAVMPIVARFV